MNHDEAVRDQLAEGYLLGDLPRETRDAFEEHYFGCQECAKDVRDSVAFAGAVRASGAAQENPFLRRQIERMKRRLVIPLAAAASILAVTLGWVGLDVVPHLQMAAAEAPRSAAARTPQLVHAYQLEAFRGDESPAPQHLSAREPSQLDVVVPADDSAQYTCLIVDAQGVTRYQLPPVSAAQAAYGIHIHMPPGALEPGKYTLRVDGKRPRIAEYPFMVR